MGGRDANAFQQRGIQLIKLLSACPPPSPPPPPPKTCIPARVCVCFPKLALIKQPFGTLLLLKADSPPHPPPPETCFSNCSRSPKRNWSCPPPPKKKTKHKKQQQAARQQALPAVAMATRVILSNEGEGGFGGGAKAVSEVGQKQFLKCARTKLEL